MADATFSSYFDAYNAGKAAGAAKDQAGGAEVSRPSTPSTNRYSPSPNRMRRSPNPGLPMYFSPMPQKTVSVLHRPKNPPMSMKNAEMLDVQYERDKQAFDRHAAGMRRQMHESWHHNGPSVLTLWEQGHIVDKGKGRTEVQASQGVFDPILSEFKIPPSPEVAAKSSKRPQSAPHARPSTAPSTPLRMDKQLQEARGTRDPITGEYRTAPAPEYASRKAVEFERSHGGRGIASRASKDFSFNPITGDYKPLSPAAVKGAVRPQSAPRAVRTPGTDAAGGAPSTSATLGNRGKVMSGDSWGTYNPVHHVWSAPPKDARFLNPSDQLEKKVGLTGSHVRAAEPRCDQGVYNPITNQWVVPPSNPRIMAGLSFAPATMFSRPSPSTAARSLAL